MADRSEPSMEDILASIKRIIADDPPIPPPQMPVQPPPAEPVAPRAPLLPPRTSLDEPPPWPNQRSEPRPSESILELTERIADAPIPPRFGAERPLAPPPLDSVAPEPIPHFQPLPPEDLQPAPQPQAWAQAAPQPQPVQRAVDRLRQAEAEMPQPAPRPVPRDLMPRTPTPRPTGGDVTLDALVREMLQPMLADWIDRNLPDMVERLVQAEIRRMSDKEG